MVQRSTLFTHGKVEARRRRVRFLGDFLKQALRFMRTSAAARYVGDNGRKAAMAPSKSPVPARAVARHWAHWRCMRSIQGAPIRIAGEKAGQFLSWHGLLTANSI